MAEVEMNIDAGRKRRLPVWMLGVSGADELSKSGKKDESCVPLQEEIQPEVPRSKVKSTTRHSRKKICTQETETLDGHSHFLLKCETRERTRKASSRDVGPSTSFTSSGEADLQKKKGRKRDSGNEPKKVMKRTASKKQKSKVNGLECSEEPEAVSPIEENEDDVELTMEDLMSIAREYVNADKEKQQQQAVTRDSKLEAHSSKSSVFSRNNLGQSFEAAGSNLGLSKCTSTACSSHLTESGRKEKENPTLENAPTHIIKTGDAAQDMLDLFLGPLLKKPLTEERKREIITTEDMALTHEFSKQDRNAVVGKATVPSIKKKSSLKDKVAMFLD